MGKVPKATMKLSANCPAYADLDNEATRLQYIIFHK